MFRPLPGSRQFKLKNAWFCQAAILFLAWIAFRVRITVSLSLPSLAVTAAPSAVPAAIHTGGQGKGGRQGARTSAPPTIDYYASGKGSVHVQITAGKGSAHVDTAGKGSAHTNTSTVGGKGSAHTSDSTVGGQGSVHTSAPTTAPTTGCVDNSHSGLKNHGVYQSCARAVGALSCDHAKYGAKLKLYCPKTCGACAGAPLPTRGSPSRGLPAQFAPARPRNVGVRTQWACTGWGVGDGV